MQPLTAHIVSLLNQCATLSHLKQLQAHLILLGHGQTNFYAFKLLRFAAPLSLPYARRIFDSLRSPSPHLFAALIASYSRSLPLPSLHLFQHMLRTAPPHPNHFIFPHALKSSADLSLPGLSKSIHALILKTGFNHHSIVQTSLLDAYSRFSDLLSARFIFDAMSERNVVSWTAMVSGYCRGGMVGNAILLFEQTPEKDVPAWNAVISGCAQNGLFTDAVAFFRRMLLSGVLPNRTTVLCALSACGHQGMLRVGKWVHGYVLRGHMGDSCFVTNALIDMYGKCGSLKEVRWISHTLAEKNLTTWNSMINCFALHGQSESAIATFREMLVDGSEPDEITFVGLLNACVHAGLVDEGLGYFEAMTKDYRIQPQIEHYGCMIDLLGRGGRFEEATRVIRDMRVEPDELVWGSLLNSCRIHKEVDLAELAVKKLQEIAPDNAEYGIILANLHSECGNWEEVRKVRKTLKAGRGRKLPGCSWIEVHGEVHQFYSCDKSHPGVVLICELLGESIGSMEA